MYQVLLYGPNLFKFWVLTNKRVFDVCTKQVNIIYTSKNKTKLNYKEDIIL